MTICACYYGYNTNKENFDNFKYIFRRDMPWFVIKMDSKPKVHKNVYLKLLNSPEYFRFNKYAYSDMDKQFLYTINLSKTKDIRNRFDLHLNDPNYLVTAYIKLFRNETIDHMFTTKHNFKNINFVTSLYNPNMSDLLELVLNEDKTYSLKTRVDCRWSKDEYLWVKMENNELIFDNYKTQNVAKFHLVDENENRIMITK